MEAKRRGIEGAVVRGLRLQSHRIMNMSNNADMAGPPVCEVGCWIPSEVNL
jgi:hypothetical protein